MKIELLAPAGSPEALRAAVRNGAGAVYLGWGDFNARRNAKNFSDTEFQEAVYACHLYGVRVFLALNILLTDRELPQAFELARIAGNTGVDAVLVQDWGLFELLRRRLPTLPLHASTQMSVFTSGGACEVARDGCERVVLARECSKEDVAAICQRCPAEVEVFAHGALCMCYSGQCAMSALIGGRSGNRGRCAQPCRLPYGVNAPAGGKYPLSLKDLCLAGSLSEMAAMGVACVKLEGRMKRPEYVAAVTRIYAQLLKENRKPDAAELAELEQAFSRSGFTDWYWQGKRGPEMSGIRRENTLNACAPRLDDDAMPERAIAVDMVCTAKAGEPCGLTVSDGVRSVFVSGPVPQNAQNRAVTAEEIEDRLRKTGNTPYRCERVSADVGEGLFLSAKDVNALRRKALTSLTEARAAVPERPEPLPALPEPADDCRITGAPAFTVSIMKLEQATPALLECGPKRIYAPLEELQSLAALPFADKDVEWCAVLPRIWRDRDEARFGHWLDHAVSLGVQGILTGNIGHLPLVRSRTLAIYGDFGWNVLNSRSLEYLSSKGLASVCVSFELRFSQIRDMRMCLPVEAIVYGRLPLMITENCLIKNNVGCRCSRSNVLRDRTGAAFPLLPAYECRTEVENSRILWLADRPAYRKLGLAYARLRFTTETPEECVRVFRAYQKGEPASGDFTRGLYERGVE